MRVLVLCALLITTGCASRPHYPLQDLPLPAASGAGCCWQATQQLEIHYRQAVHRLGAALARTAEGASLVLLDPMGRRLFSIRQRNTTLETWRSPEMPEGLPERFLLASSMLAWWPLTEWQVSATGEWSLVTGTRTRQLRYRGAPLLTITYSPSSRSPAAGIDSTTVVRNETVLLEHHKTPLRITVVTTHWELL
jgi:hypothetical protein